MNLNPIDYFALDVSQDYDTENDEPIAVFTFTPRKNRFDHFHIEIRKKDIINLKEWIDKFLDDQ